MELKDTDYKQGQESVKERLKAVEAGVAANTKTIDGAKSLFKKIGTAIAILIVSAIAIQYIPGLNQNAGVEQRLEQIFLKLDEKANRLESSESRLDTKDLRITALEQNFERVDSKLDVLIERLE